MVSVERLTKVLECLKADNISKLVFNGGGYVPLKEISILLKTNTKLEHLILNDSQLDPDDAILLAEGLRENRGITKLELSGNEIGARGAIALATALQHNVALKYLSLDGNRIGDEGATAIADMLRVNRVLEKLFLQSNNLREAGIMALIKEAFENKTINELNVRGCDLSPESNRLIRELKLLNPNFWLGMGTEFGTIYYGDDYVSSLAAERRGAEGSRQR